MKILITGANGFIGRNLYKSLQACKQYEVIGLTRKDCDLTDCLQVNEYFKDKYFDIVIHTAINGGRRLIKDEPSIFHNNLVMAVNLLANKQSFKYFFNFSSGAENNEAIDNGLYYAASKYIITNMVRNYNWARQFKIYGCFGVDEEPQRLIKSSILRYINKEPMVCNENKYMDFIYIEDVCTIIKHYINHIEDIGLLHEIDLVYAEKYKLLGILNIINNLDNYKVDIIQVDTTLKNHYCGRFALDQIDALDRHIVGIHSGIKAVYNECKSMLHE